MPVPGPTVAGAKSRTSSRLLSGLATGKPNPLRYQRIPAFLTSEQLALHWAAHYRKALLEYRRASEWWRSSARWVRKKDHNPTLPEIHGLRAGFFENG